MLKKVNNFLAIIVDNLSWIILSFMTIIVTFQVLNRNVFHMEAMWTEEIAKYMFVWLIMLASAVATNLKEHITVDMIFQLWPCKVTQVLGMVGDFIHTAYYFILLYSTYKWASGFKGILTEVSRIPVQIFYYMLPACAMVMLLYQLGHTVDSVKTLISGRDAVGGEKA
jgi:TRAP-type C4-dicarboxylate transport system permease small subunit